MNLAQKTAQIRMFLAVVSKTPPCGHQMSAIDFK
jgi:hypothetical protein